MSLSRSEFGRGGDRVTFGKCHVELYVNDSTTRSFEGTIRIMSTTKRNRGEDKTGRYSTIHLLDLHLSSIFFVWVHPSRHKAQATTQSHTRPLTFVSCFPPRSKKTMSANAFNVARRMSSRNEPDLLRKCRLHQSSSWSSFLDRTRGVSLGHCCDA